MAGRAGRAQLLVARVAGRVVGSVALVLDGDFGEITAGRAMMVLSTDPRMTAAHRLYEPLGFRRLPERD